MRSEHERDERRRHFRAQVIGCAILHVPGHALRGDIGNLSLGGVLVRRDDDHAPCPAVGSRVAVELELAGSGWITQRGIVKRADLCGVALSFDAVTAKIEELIEDEVIAAVEAQTSPRVVVIDGSPERRQQVASALAEAGCSPLEAATPLEAVRLLGRAGGTGVSGVAVGDTMTQTDRDELVDFLVDTNPGIQIALIGPRPANPRSTRPDAVLGEGLRAPTLAFGARLRQPTGPISTIGRARRAR